MMVIGVSGVCVCVIFFIVRSVWIDGSDVIAVNDDKVRTIIDCQWI